MELCDLVQKLSLLQAKRKEREKIVEQMKDMEKTIRGMIRTSLVAAGAKTMNFDGVGSVSTSSRDHAEIRDFNVFADFILDTAMKARENGTPVADALAVLQRRAATGNIQELLELGYTTEQLGVEIVEKQDITFTPAK